MSQEVGTEITPTPQSSFSPQPLPGSSSPPAPWPLAAFTNVTSTALAAWTAYQVGKFLPTTFALLVQSGKVSTDVMAWVPFSLNLLALIAIGSPVSLAPLISLVRTWLPGRSV